MRWAALPPDSANWVGEAVMILTAAGEFQVVVAALVTVSNDDGMWLMVVDTMGCLWNWDGIIRIHSSAPHPEMLG